MMMGLLWLILGLPLLLVVRWAWRHVDLAEFAPTSSSDVPEEPCWTEQISIDGQLSYGRYGCYHAHLAEADAMPWIHDVNRHVY